VRFPLRSSAAFALALWSLLWFGMPTVSVCADEATDLLVRVNQLRAQRHLMPLRFSAELARVAAGHADELASTGSFSHTNAAGQNPLDRVQSAGISGFALLAENIGKTNVSSDQLHALMDGWMASTSHRENLLNPAFNTTGIAVIATPAGESIAVELFATF
jgi:uncharacterized protein YkwD